jgi:putative DNA primase/helicase
MPGDDRITASIAAFGEAIEGSARDMLAVAEAEEQEGASSARQEAEAFLVDLLVDEPVPANKVKAAASAAALSWITVRRAKEKLGVITRKGGMDGGWQWSLPAEGAHQESKMLTPQSVSPFGKNEHLRADEGEVEL